LEEGTVLTENSAILQYIAEQYPAAQLAPPASDRVGRAKLRQWLSFISSELHKGLMTPLLGEKTPPEVKAWSLSKYAPRLAYLDAKLNDREFLLDRFSVADGYLTTVLNWTRATPEIDLTAYPNVKAYLERMRARPSVAAALATEIPLFHAEVARRKAAGGYAIKAGDGEGPGGRVGEGRRRGCQKTAPDGVRRRDHQPLAFAHGADLPDAEIFGPVVCVQSFDDDD